MFSIILKHKLIKLLRLLHKIVAQKILRFLDKTVLYQTFLGTKVLLAKSLICSKSPVLKILVPHLSRFSAKILGEI